MRRREPQRRITTSPLPFGVVRPPPAPVFFFVLPLFRFSSGRARFLLDWVVLETCACNLLVCVDRCLGRSFFYSRLMAAQGASVSFGYQVHQLCWSAGEAMEDCESHPLILPGVALVYGFLPVGGDLGRPFRNRNNSRATISERTPRSS